MKFKTIDILDKYNDAFREVVVEKLNRIPDDIEDFNKRIKKTFVLSKIEDWAFLLTAMDIVGDSNMAFHHFMKFGLQGATKLEDYGESYLRLYGLLNATYIQQQAIINLYKICHVPDFSNTFQKIKLLGIRDTRHKLGAHSNDFLNENRNKESFVPVRMSFSKYICEYANNTEDTFHCINLKNLLIQHLDLMAEIYDQIYEKFIKTLYKSGPEKIKSLMQEVAILRSQRDAGSAKIAKINNAINKDITIVSS